MRRKRMIITAGFLLGLIIFSNGWAEESSGKVAEGVRVIEMEVFRYGYRPDPVVVKEGEKVRSLMTATDVTYGSAISDLAVPVLNNWGKKKRKKL